MKVKNKDYRFYGSTLELEVLDIRLCRHHEIVNRQPKVGPLRFEVSTLSIYLPKMKRIQTLSSSPLLCTSQKIPPSLQCLHTTPRRKAVALPNTAAGPPPSAPLPAASEYGERVNRRRRQAELLKRGQDLRVSHMKPGSALKKRFWKDVHVKTTDGTLPTLNP